MSCLFNLLCHVLCWPTFPQPFVVDEQTFLLIVKTFVLLVESRFQFVELLFDPAGIPSAAYPLHQTRSLQAYIAKNQAGLSRSPYSLTGQTDPVELAT